jgi:hypothetical protein
MRLIREVLIVVALVPKRTGAGSYPLPGQTRGSAAGYQGQVKVGTNTR